MRFLSLASSRFGWREGDPYVHPAAVDVSVTGVTPMVAISEGAAHGAVGGAFSPAEALTFGRVFAQSGGGWIVPFVERLRDGEAVTEQELVDAFRARHGREPMTFEWRLAVEDD